MSLAVVCVSSGTALAANKLIVKGTDGTTDRFVVTDGGWIGLGTSAPSYPIHVVGTGEPGNAALYMIHTGRATNYQATDSPGLNFFRTNDVTVNGGMPRSNDRLGYFGFGSRIDGLNRYSGVLATYAEGTWSSTSTPGYMCLFTTNSGTTNPTEKVRIASTGNVGIGTTAPAQKLDVSGGIRINSSGTQPTCNAANRGTLWLVQGTTDVLQICVQDSGSPVWKTITLQ